MVTHARELIGFQVWSEGIKIGKIEDLYFEDTDWIVRYLVVDTGGWLDHHEVLLIPSIFDRFDFQLRVAHPRLSRMEIEKSPPPSADIPVSRQFEERLHAHYGWEPYWLGPELGLSPVSDMTQPSSRTIAIENNLASSDPHLQSFDSLKGFKVRATDGIAGRLDDLLIDTEEWRITGLTVSLREWLSGKPAQVNVAKVKSISVENRDITVGLDRMQIKSLQVREPKESEEFRLNH